MTDVKVEEIFDCAFVSVTKKIASLDLCRKSDGSLKIDDEYAGSVYTTGMFNSLVVMEFSPAICKHIIFTMTNGAEVTDEERLLYMKEYVNIVCGRAISAINDETGSISRITIPAFHSLEEIISEVDKKSKKIVLHYETDIGIICVSVYYNDFGK